jgi:UDP-N-acetylmuramoyl-tripeptide--D-alanyl-D-alanine ligase
MRTVRRRSGGVIALTLAEVAAACAGRLHAPDPDVVVRSVTTDSRSVSAGDLFVGLRGDQFDGDTYAAQALADGAAAVVVRAETARALPFGGASIVVDDGLTALGALARECRRRSAARLVAITGSTGKTSTKDILAAFLRPLCRVVATQGNFNNEIGVPLTLLDADEETDVVVCELAMRGAGQIRDLAKIAMPDVGVITNIAPVHLELVGTIEDVAAAKAELIEGLHGRSAVVPAGEGLLAAHLERHTGRRVTFGPGGDVWLAETEAREGGTRALVDAFGHRAALWFNFSGEHYLQDALAALGAFMELGHPLVAARQGAGEVVFSANRGEVVDLSGGGLLLNDAYNANPLAMRAALDHLIELADDRPCAAVLGDMYELGRHTISYHHEVGEYAAGLGVRVLAVGALAKDYLTGAPGEVWYPSVEACLAALPAALPAGSAVLVKASRGLRLERVADWIRQTMGAGEIPGSDQTPAREDPRD